MKGLRGAGSHDTVRLVLIASTVVACGLSVWFGLPRLRLMITPDIERAWVVSASLGDEAASGGAHEVLAGTPVSLYAIVETRSGDGERRLFGPVERVRFGGEDGEVFEVEPWSDWWYELAFFWFKVEPLFPFDNETLAADYDPETIQYHDTFMLAWGFPDRHPLDIRPTGDAYPKWEVGTMRFKVQAVVRDAADRVLDEALSPGADGVHSMSVYERPHRVTVRASDAPLGILQGWAGLPYVPVMAEIPPERHPAERMIGGTILDFWVGTQRRLGSALPYPRWEDLPRYADVVIDEMFLAEDGSYYRLSAPQTQVTWEQVRAGDLVGIEDHFGVLYQDRSPGGGGDGILNRWDRILGGYFEPIRDIPIGEAFVSGATVFRLREDGGTGG